MSYDYDVLVIGSGFGGSVTALRLTEKGYRVGVLEAGRRFSDEQFAKTKALSAAQHKHYGRRRASIALRQAGVSGAVADRALDDVYGSHDSTAVARRLAEKQAPRLRKLEPVVARRRLVGMLQRRGFDYESIKPVVDEVLGKGEA